jgi:phage regulator Rha-like protein
MTDDLEAARIKKKLSELTATTGLIDSHDVAGLFERPHEEILLIIDDILRTAPAPADEWFKPVYRAHGRAFDLTRQGFWLVAWELPGDRSMSLKIEIAKAFEAMHRQAQREQ